QQQVGGGLGRIASRPAPRSCVAAPPASRVAGRPSYPVRITAARRVSTRRAFSILARRGLEALSPARLDSEPPHQRFMADPKGRGGRETNHNDWRSFGSQQRL